MKNAIILCSGGLDSVVAAHYAKKRMEYENIIILFFDYGQKSLDKERESSEKCASDVEASFVMMKLEELGKMSASLINAPGEVREMKREDLKDSKEESEKWYVPCRNQIFLSYALAIAESKFDKCSIFVGFKNEGAESYPDTTKAFVEDFNKLAKSCKGEFRVIAPLHDKDKEDIVSLGAELGVELGKTWSCFVSSSDKQCGKCLACALRKEGFYWANVEDTTEYDS